MAQRVELARLAANERVRGEGVVDGGDLQPLARLDAQPGLAGHGAPPARGPPSSQVHGRGQ